MLKLRYFADILALDNSQVRVNIYKDTDEVVVAEEVQLLPDGLIIEHKDTDKLEPIQSSSLTLKLNSATNFQFLELYSLQDGSFIVEVLRNNALIWSGVLDSNLYEEPLNYHENYDVQVTASTFGILDRKTLRTVEGNKLNGTITLPELIIEALKVSKLRFNNLYFCTETTLSNITPTRTIFDLFFDVNALYNNDDKCTWLKAIEEVLRPFALTFRYINGNVYIFDLQCVLNNMIAIKRYNNKFESLTPIQLNHFVPIDLDTLGFDGAEHSVSFDKVLNNIEVEFKPAIQSNLIDYEVEAPKSAQATATKYTAIEAKNDNSSQPQHIGFETYLFDEAPLNKGLKKATGYYFSNKERGSNSGDDTGVILPTRHFIGIVPTEILSLKWCDLAANQRKQITSNEAGKYVYVSDDVSTKIKLDVNIMFDPRYNPFEPEGRENEEGNTRRFNNRVGCLLIPVNIYLSDGNGNITHIYDNSNVRSSQSNSPFDFKGRWITSSTKQPYKTMLYYYDSTNPNENNAMPAGWNNCKREIVSKYRFDDATSVGSCDFGKISTSDQKDQGFIIPEPPVSGYLHVEILTGCGVYRKAVSQVDEFDFSTIRWYAIKDIKVSILDFWGHLIDDDNYVYNSWVNQSAYEEESVKTILGSNTDNVISAYGNLYTNINGQQKIITHFSKGENLKKPLEELLISSYYSNYYDRSLIIKAETNATINGIIFTYNKVFPNKKFLIRESETNLYEATSNITITEVKKDSFTLTKIDEKYE